MRDDDLIMFRDTANRRTAFQIRTVGGRVDVTRLILTRDATGNNFNEVTSTPLVRVSKLNVTWDPAGGVLGPYSVTTPVSATAISTVASEAVSYSLIKAPAWATISPRTPQILGTIPYEGLFQFSAVAKGLKSSDASVLPLTIEAVDVRLSWPAISDLQAWYNDRGQLSYNLGLTNPENHLITYKILQPTNATALGIAVAADGTVTASQRIGFASTQIQARTERRGLFTEEDRTFTLKPANFLRTRDSRRSAVFDIEQPTPASHPQTVLDPFNLSQAPGTGETVQRLTSSTAPARGFVGKVDVFARGTTILVRFRERTSSNAPIIDLPGVARLYSRQGTVYVGTLQVGSSSTANLIPTTVPRTSGGAAWETVGISVATGSSSASANGETGIAPVQTSTLQTALKDLAIGYLVGDNLSTAVLHDIDISHVYVMDNAYTAEETAAETGALAHGIRTTQRILRRVDGASWGTAHTAIHGHHVAVATRSMVASAPGSVTRTFTTDAGKYPPDLVSGSLRFRSSVDHYLVSREAWPVASFTVVVRVKFAVSQIASRRVFSLENSSNANEYTYIQLESGGLRWGWRPKSAGSTLSRTSASPAVDTWTTLAMTVSSTTMRAYRDGSEVANATHAYTLDNTWDRLVLGNVGTGGACADADISHVLMYDKALSASEVSSLQLGTNSARTDPVVVNVEARSLPLDTYVINFAGTASANLPSVEGSVWVDAAQTVPWYQFGGLDTPASVQYVQASAAQARTLTFPADAGYVVAVRSLGVSWDPPSVLDLRPYYTHTDRTVRRQLNVVGSFMGGAAYTSSVPGLVSATGFLQDTFGSGSETVRVVATVWRDGVRNALEITFALLNLNTKALFSGNWGSSILRWTPVPSISQPTFLLDSDNLYVARFPGTNARLTAGTITTGQAGATFTIRIKRVGQRARTECLLFLAGSSSGLYAFYTGADFYVDLFKEDSNTVKVSGTFTTSASDVWVSYTIAMAPTALRVWEDGVLRINEPHTFSVAREFDKVYLANRKPTAADANVECDISHALVNQTGLVASEVTTLLGNLPIAWATQAPLGVFYRGTAASIPLHASVANAYEVVAGPGTWMKKFAVKFNRDDLDANTTQCSVYWTRGEYEADAVWSAITVDGVNRVYNNVTKRVFQIYATNNTNASFYQMFIRSFTRTDMNLRVFGGGPSNVVHTWYMWRGDNAFEVDVLGTAFEPPGLKMNTSTGEITGMPAVQALNSLTVRATSLSGESTDRVFDLPIAGTHIRSAAYGSRDVWFVNRNLGVSPTFSTLGSLAIATTTSSNYDFGSLLTPFVLPPDCSGITLVVRFNHAVRGPMQRLLQLLNPGYLSSFLDNSTFTLSNNGQASCSLPNIPLSEWVTIGMVVDTNADTMRIVDNHSASASVSISSTYSLAGVSYSNLVIGQTDQPSFIGSLSHALVFDTPRTDVAAIVADVAQTNAIAPTWSTAQALANATTAQAYTYVVAATNVKANGYSKVSGTGAVSATGTITGTAGGVGAYSITVRATSIESDAVYTDRTFTFNAVAAPVWTTSAANFVDLALNEAITNLQLSATTNPSATLTYSLVAPNTLPTGLTLTCSGLISGTPTALGTYNFTLRATNASAQNGYTDLAASVVVAKRPSWTTAAALANATAAQAYSYTVSANDALSTGYTKQGGTATTAAVSAAGVISNSSAGAIGSYTVIVRAVSTTSSAIYSDRTFTFSAVAAPVWTTSAANFVDLALNEATTNVQLAATTSPAATLTYSLVTPNTLPTGLTLTSAGLISGTPTALGTYSFTLRVTNASAQNGYTDLAASVVVAKRPSWTTAAALANATTAQAYSYTVSANDALGTGYTKQGGTATSAAVSAAGVISSSSAGAIGSYTVIVRAVSTTSSAIYAERTFTFSAVAAPVWTTSAANFFDLALNEAMTSLQLAATTSPAATLTYSLVTPNTLPTGLTLTSAGLISGTPTALGTYSFTLRVTNASAQNGYTDLAASVIVAKRPSWTTASALANATTAQAYSYTVSANDALTTGYTKQGGTATTADVSAAGVISNSSAGAIGSYTVIVRAVSTTSSAIYSDRTFTFSSVAAPVWTTADADFLDLALNEAMTSLQLAATTSPAATLTYSLVTPNTLPTGLTLTSAGLISGTPSALGTYSFSVRATNASAQNGYTDLATSVIVAKRPSWTTAAALANATTGQAYSYTVSANDALGTGYTKQGGTATTASVSAAGVISNSSAGAVGSYTVIVRAVSTTSSSIYSDRTFTFSSVAAPVWTTANADFLDLALNEAMTSLQLAATTSPAATLTYSLVTAQHTTHRSHTYECGPDQRDTICPGNIQLQCTCDQCQRTERVHRSCNQRDCCETTQLDHSSCVGKRHNWPGVFLHGVCKRCAGHWIHKTRGHCHNCISICCRCNIQQLCRRSRLLHCHRACR